MIWDRLEQCYGSAEVIEDALIDSFPKVTNRDYSKLRKLHDIVMELQSAKTEGDLPGLSFLDTARGVNLIVQKLTYNLQEKWSSVSASYKRNHHISFPPLSVFVDVVSQEADIKNDLSFNLALHTDMMPKAGKPHWKLNKQREISVHKTEIHPRLSSDAERFSKKSDDCNKHCPVHQKRHSLLKCGAFQEKPI